MKIISKKKIAQDAKFDELYDWVDDDTVEQIDAYNTDDINIIDYDALERGEVPVVNINDQVVNDTLVDNLEEEAIEVRDYKDQGITDGLEENEPFVGKPEDVLVEDPETEVDVEEEEIPEFSSTLEAMEWAKDNNRVVKIFYTTEGRGSRDESKYLKRERGLPKSKGGVSIYRIVEPHHIYKAGNGNLVLITYDRSVRKIRSFIINNITDYNFTQNRRTKKPQHFKQRIRALPKSEKGIKIMKNIKEQLVKVAQEVEDKGMVKSSTIIREVEKVVDDLKTAQYVGVQGYWLRNRRCWDNCYRYKRSATPKKPAQEVWFECWDEYKKAINNDNSGWEKYASETEVVKIEEIDIEDNEVVKWDEIFASKVDKKIKEGSTTPIAIYSTIEEESQKHADKILDSSFRLMSLAEAFADNNMEEIGNKLASIATDMLKEAQFQGNNPGGFWRGLVSPLERGGKWLADKWTGKGGKSDVVKKIQDVIGRVNQLLMNLNNPSQSSAQPLQRATKTENKNKIIIEAKKKIKEAVITPAGQSAGTGVGGAVGTNPVNPGPAPVQPAPVQPAPVQPDPAPDGLSQQYNKIVEDMNLLMKEFSGIASSTKDAQVSKYISQINPLLNSFVGEGINIRKMPPGREQRESLRTSLNKLSGDLQGVLTNIQQSGNITGVDLDRDGDVDEVDKAIEQQTSAEEIPATNNGDYSVESIIRNMNPKDVQFLIQQLKMIPSQK